MMATFRFSFVTGFAIGTFVGTRSAMNTRFIILKAVGAGLLLMLLYVLSYSPVMAIIFWGFNAGKVNETTLQAADIFYAPVVKLWLFPEYLSPYEGFWRDFGMRIFR